MRRTVLLLVLMGVASIAAAQEFPAAETFAPVGRKIERAEAEGIARRVGASRDLARAELMEFTLEKTGATPGWRLVIAGKGKDGACRSVHVGVSIADGRVYDIKDRKASGVGLPANCGDWYVETALTSAPEAPAPTVAASSSGTKTVTDTTTTTKKTTTRKVVDAEAPKTAIEKSEAEDKAKRAAKSRGYNKIRIESVQWREAAGTDPAYWKIDMVGINGTGCGILKIEVRSPEWNVRWKDRQIRGEDVKVQECVDAYAAESKTTAVPMTDAAEPEEDIDLPVVDE